MQKITVLIFQSDCKGIFDWHNIGSEFDQCKCRFCVDATLMCASLDIRLHL